MGVKEKVSEGMSSAAQSAEDAVDRGVQRAKDAGHAASGMAHEVVSDCCWGAGTGVVYLA
jgi:hypothetical protein